MDVWSRVVVLSLGGALGVNARYWLGVAMARWTDPRFPYATVTINVTGSFAIGFLAVLLGHHWPHPLARLFIVTGFLGGYTTFSSFCYESLQLWEGGRPGLSIANTLGSVVAGLIAVVLGVAVARSMIGSGESVRRVAQPSATVTHHLPEPLPPDAILEGEVEEV
jgi:CrcB protein